MQNEPGLDFIRDEIARTDESGISGWAGLHQRVAVIPAVILIATIVGGEGSAAPRRRAETEPEVVRLAGNGRVLEKHRLAENVLRGGKLIILPDALLLQLRFGKQDGEGDFRVDRKSTRLNSSH